MDEPVTILFFYYEQNIAARNIMAVRNIMTEQIQKTIGDIIEPASGRKLDELKMITSVDVSDSGDITVEVELPTPAFPQPEQIEQAIVAAFPDQNVAVNFRSTVKGDITGGKVGLKVKHVIAVGSGKGGVGKSTMAASIAYGLSSYGAKVGLLDADVYGPSIPHMAGAEGPPAMVRYETPDGQTYERMQPVEANGVKLMSIGFIVPPEQAIVWRGPMLHKALTDFLQRTDWGELDYLIVDMPPGTGDVALTLSQLLNLSGAVVVCTPQQVALLDAVKAINMFRQVKIPVLGIVENMTGDIFGRGGAKEKAEEMSVPFLGELPIEANVREQGDAGKIAALLNEESPSRDSLRGICEQVALQIALNQLSAPALPTLEIL